MASGQSADAFCVATTFQHSAYSQYWAKFSGNGAKGLRTSCDSGSRDLAFASIRTAAWSARRSGLIARAGPSSASCRWVSSIPEEVIDLLAGRDSRRLVSAGIDIREQGLRYFHFTNAIARLKPEVPLERVPRRI